MKVWELRKKIRAAQSRATLIKFLFSEYKQICEFGKNTHVLYPRMFPLGIQLNSDIHTTFTKYLQPQSIELYKALAYILKKKWSSLERREYNLVLVLKKLCEKIALTNFNLLNYTDKNLIDRLRSLETYFIALYVQENYPHILITAVKRILQDDSHFKMQVPELLGAMNRLVLQDVDTPSLYNFLLGLNMLKYRRYLNMQDLVNCNCGDIMGLQFFEYEPDVQQEIQLFVKECEKNLKFLSAKKQEIEMIRQFLPHKDGGDINFGMLHYFYASSQLEGEYQFERDLDDVVQLSLRILKTYRKSFRNLLCGKVRLFGSGKCRVFPDGCFRKEFGQIDKLIERLGKLSYDHTNAISFKQYLQMKQTKKFTSKIESDAIMLISDSLHLVYNLGKRVAFLLSARIEKVESGTPEEEGGTSSDRLVVPEQILKARIMSDDVRLGGKGVADALSFMVSISFLICHYYHDRYTYALLSKEEMIQREIKLKMEMLARITTPELYTKLVNTYGT